MYKALIPQRLVACFDRRVYVLSVNSSVRYDHPIKTGHVLGREAVL